MKEVIQAFGDTAALKVNQINTSKSKFFVSGMMAGFFIGLGIILIFTIGGLLSPISPELARIVMGVSFGIALSLVLMAGADLFTGNNMIMTIGTLEKRTTWKDTWKIWGFGFLANFAGSVTAAVLYFYSGLWQGATAEFITATASVKMNLPFMELLVRGILCNILVCLAIWCAFKLKSDTAKLIMIFWCLFAFITSGFEHSIANMTLLSIGLLVPHPETVTLAGMAHNLIPVSIGNMIGGIVFVGGAYWYTSSATVPKLDRAAKPAILQVERKTPESSAR
ncbi:formate/nitrite transporter family protein [Alkalicoccus daliensis]|uniref:Hydrosulfide channel, FNT family n=1 Tax=Alkalicoccus daliensis TaxID=745820 RepID=A0A1H0E449_9BACI|nr:formate/nitrite transporter family protein [Alkalicoccus daliensis]SDN77058.1 hydrosulfide channel, FNT family [Alkalicoccus daliensis]